MQNAKTRDVITIVFDILQALAIGERIVDQVQNVIGLVIRQVSLENMDFFVYTII